MPNISFEQAVQKNEMIKEQAEETFRERINRLINMPISEHGPFSARPLQNMYWGVFDCLGREYIIYGFEKIPLTKENAKFIADALNLFSSASLLDGS